MTTRCGLSLDLFRDEDQFHTSKVRGVAVALELSIIVTASQDCTARVWSALSGRWRCACKIVENEEVKAVAVAALSNDDKRRLMVITASGDGTCGIWLSELDLLNFSKVQTITPLIPEGLTFLKDVVDKPYACCLAIAPNTKFIAFGTTVQATKFHVGPDGGGTLGCSTQIYRTSYDSTDENMWEHAQTLTSKSGQPVRAVEISPKSKMVFVGASDGKVRIYAPVENVGGRRLSVCREHSTWSAKGWERLEEIQVLMHPSGGMVRPAVTPHKIPALARSAVRATAISSDEEIFITCGNDCQVQIYLRHQELHPTFASKLWEHDETLGVTADVIHGSTNHHRAHSNNVFSVKIAPGATRQDRKFIVSAGKDCKAVVWMWNQNSGEILDEKSGQRKGEYLFMYVLRHTGWIWQLDICMGKFEPGSKIGVNTDVTNQCTIVCGLNESSVAGDQTAAIWRVSTDGSFRPYKRTHIRPATPFEILFPLVVQVATFLQTLSMAARSTFSWNHNAISPMTNLRTLVMIELHLEWLDVDDAFMKFALQQSVTALLLGFFVISALTQTNRPLQYLVSTILVMPIWRQVVTSIDCYKGRLEVDEDLVCFHRTHYWIAGVMVTLGSIFLLLLLPFTAAGGDPDIVPPSIWLRPREWRNRRRDKSTGIDLGKMNTSSNPKKNLLYAYSVLFFQIAVTTAGILSTYHPCRDAFSSFTFSWVPLVVCWWSHPMEDPLMSRMQFSFHLTVTVAFGCAAISAYLDNASSIYPAVGLYVSVIAVMLEFAVWCKRQMQNRDPSLDWNDSDILGRLKIMYKANRSHQYSRAGLTSVDLAS